jgi:hypothetical protein
MPEHTEIFRPDEGSLLEVVVFETTTNDWDCLLCHLEERYSVDFTIDGIPNPRRNFADILKLRETSSVAIRVWIGDFSANSQFSRDDQIIFDILPDEVSSAETAAAVFRFMMTMSQALDKEVFLTPEYASASPVVRKKMAICIAEPGKPTVRTVR